jgi:VIT1/CCC1 family predicted Fe2+/Mn2+ transporter
MSELPKKAADDSDAEIRDAAINARLEALEAELEALDIKVYLLSPVAGSALFIAAFLVWPQGWGQATLFVATFAVVAALGLLYGVMVNWKTYSLWGKVVVWLVFGMIWAAFAAWLPH